MTITLDLPAETEAKLREEAQRSGLDVDTFVLSIVERAVLPPWRDLIEPLKQQSRDMGLSEDDVAKLVDAEIGEVRRHTPLWKR